ncbi:hypothetical protein D0Z08_04825 [Nocardioides immobilis]|uniref:Lsr2 DNA-binding domain-containing protein n=2 Tax=Nocardioides immobilis TaxID=2049295 RepID=A0A417Y6U4_9ACTN|nr:hypothetical protein D0Z08_04825 [Nocardioides immobilis]
MRVLGALYGVTLVVSPDEQDRTRSARKTASKPARKSANKVAASKKTVNGAPSAKKKTPVVASSTKAAKPRSKQKTAQRSVSASRNAEVRSWARQNGFTVSDRGRLPASVVTAYRNAQSA